MNKQTTISNYYLMKELGKLREIKNKKQKKELFERILKHWDYRDTESVFDTKKIKREII